MSKNRKQKMITPEIMRQAVVGAFTKLDPRYMMKNPVMFVVEIGFVISLVPVSYTHLTLPTNSMV